MLNGLTVFRSPDAAARARVERSCKAQGFGLSRAESWPADSEGIEALLWSQPSQDRVADAIVEDERGFACCVGTLWYQGKFGAAALSLLLDDFRGPQSLTEESLRGSFVVLLRNASGAWLFNDPMGFGRVYLTDDGQCLSTSWLAARSWAGSSEVAAEAAAEYVLLESVHGPGTVAPGVEKLALGAVIDLVSGRTIDCQDRSSWLVNTPYASFESAVAAFTGHYSKVFAEIVEAFPGAVNCALSGGFDSRMIAASVLAKGETPRLFVYGHPGSSDVEVARVVAASQSLPIRVVDKDEMDRSLPEPDPEALAESALFFDGLPNDGIVDRGSDRETRLLQNANGSIALNGGGGEILRNFFHLPDRRFTARDLVRAFYRGFDSGVFRRRVDFKRYEECLASSIEATVGGGGALARGKIELAYPLFRCHYWMGSNNAVELRHGYFSTPLVDRTAVRMSAAVPLAYKNAGRLQSAVIASLHPGIASQDSAYGFRFSDGPSTRARFSEWMTCARPVSMRPLINAVRRRMRRIGVDPDLVGKWRVRLPGEWRVDSILDIRNLPDDKSFERALSLEIVSRMIAP